MTSAPMGPIAGQEHSPLSIKVGGPSSAPYKSIDFVEWQDIPPFAVLTGPNGSGKTQLLQVLAHKFANIPLHQFHPLKALPFAASGETIGPHEIAYLPNAESAFRIEGSSIGSLPQLKQSFLQRLTPQSVGDNIEMQILRERVQRKYGIAISHQPSAEEAAKLPDDFLYMLEYGEVSASLSHVFVGYQIRRAEKLLERVPEDQISKDLGRPPWEFVNEALESAEFKYRIIPPTNNLLKNYQVMAEAAGSGIVMDLNDLSSGEKTILRTLLWFYNSKHNNLFPKLFLMDEPDAHLHPSMTRQFIDIVNGVLVDQYKVRVILTTHSPSTVALAPETSVFVMAREQPRIRRPASKAEAIGLLTAGLVIVSPGTRFVLVEDEADVTFYETVRNILADQGPSKDPLALRPAPSLVFMPASTGKGSGKTGGGKNVVVQWVEKFDAEPLIQMFRGIIDLDAGNIGTQRVLVLGRYSIENYQLDPVIVFGVLLQEKLAPILPGIAVTSGDEHRLRDLSGSALQTAVDFMRQRVEPTLNPLSAQEQVNVVVTFTNGVKLSYPSWMLNRRGKDLMPLYQAVFGQNVITPPNLEKMQRRIRLVPIELAKIMAQLQQS